MQTAIVGVEMSQNGGAGRRDALALAAIVMKRKPLEQLDHRRRRQRQIAMRGFYRTGTHGQRRDRPARRSALFDEVGGGDDVGDRIPGADFVKCHLFGGDAMHRALGGGEAGENILRTRQRTGR